MRIGKGQAVGLRLAVAVTVIGGFAVSAGAAQRKVLVEEFMARW